MIYLPEIDKKQQDYLMTLALNQAEWGLGGVAPNPSVGSVLYKDGRIIGRGRTSDGGRPHGEIMAIKNAKCLGHDIKGAICFVTLEPCFHIGHTAPCVDALMNENIKAVSIAMLDPNPLTNGQSMQKLKQAGVEVAVGLMQEEAKDLNKGFYLTQTQKRPLVSLKLASSLDGKLAFAENDNHQRWITGPQARNHGHFLRMRHDAIMIGAGTLRIDNPSLDCRLRGLEKYSPRPVILAGKAPLPANASLFRKHNFRPSPLILGVADRLQFDDLNHHLNDDIDYHQIATEEGCLHADMKAVMALLAEKGITRLLVEGGAKIAGNLLKANLIDEIYHYQAPFSIGDDGLAISQLEDIDKFAKEQSLNLIETRLFPDNNDRLFYYK